MIYLFFQNDFLVVFFKVKIQILSNWGYFRFICLYRVRVYGMRILEGVGESVIGGFY